MNFSHKAVTGNDNVKTRSRYFAISDAFPKPEIFWPHIPTAQKLIKRYSSYPFKHDPNDEDYAFLEYQLCTILSMKLVDSPSNRAFRIKQLAIILEQPFLSVLNAPNLPL